MVCPFLKDAIRKYTKVSVLFFSPKTLVLTEETEGGFEGCIQLVRRV